MSRAVTYREVYPYEVNEGDQVATSLNRQGLPTAWSKPIKIKVVHPRGCTGKTHLDGECYDNVTKTFVLRG